MDGAEEGDDHHPGAESLDCTSLKPARNGIAHPWTLEVVVIYEGKVAPNLKYIITLSEYHDVQEGVKAKATYNSDPKDDAL